MGSGYVASGTYRKDLETALGHALPAKDEPDEREDWLDAQLALLPPEVAAEVEALFTLHATYDIPELCGLRTGSFCTLPEQNGFDRDEVLDMFRGNEAGADAAMTSLEIFNALGPPFIVVHREGIGLLQEDPSSYHPLGCSLEAFLKMLIAADTAALRDGIEAGRAVAAKLVGEKRAPMIVLNRVLKRAPR